VKRTKICAERPKGQEGKLGMLTGSIMSKSSVFPESLIMLLTEARDISNLHKICMNKAEAYLALYTGKHTAGIQICEKCQVRNTFIKTATISRRRYVLKERQYSGFSTR